MATFTNYATLSYNGVTSNSNTVTGEVLEALAVTKTAVGEFYSVGGSVSYALSLVNSSTAPLTGLILTDDLGSYTYGTLTLYPLEAKSGSILYYVNGVLQPTPAVTLGPPLSVSGITVPAGGNALIVYEATVTEYADPTADGTVTNTVTVTGGGLMAPVTATETVTANGGAELLVTKAISPAVITENGQVTYTFTVSNRGSAATSDTDSLILADVFDPILTDITVTGGGEIWSETSDYSYNEATGEFATTDGRISVPAAEFSQNPDGSWSVTPGTFTLSVTGTL